ncbi:NAD(P)/FAD-dependent oxidoreductase [Streptomyces sp. NPDC102360]|uniref:NAD(P)/FAD-dependent oxidoreductase n=1 Tax=Streptomyces sp. NPDC102360 TaxID=3366160 RepID=UPI003829AFEC
MKVAVVGAGVIGSAIAWRLAQRGTEVLLVDSGQPGEATSRCSFAWANASSVEDPAYFALREHGLRELKGLADHLGTRWVLATGHLRWAAAEADSAKLRGRVAALAARGYPAEIVTARHANDAIEPHVRFPDPHHPVAHFPTEPSIDAPRLAKQLTSLAVAHGATALLGRPVKAVGVNRTRITDVTVGATSYPVDAVVNAAGPHSDLVAKMIGRELRLIEEPGLVARLRCTTAPVRQAMHAPCVEIRVDGRHKVLIHSRIVDNKLGPTGYAQPSHIEELRSLAGEVVPELADAEPADARVGWRPIPWDGFPSLGSAAGVHGYYEAVTHSGVTLCAIVGLLLADEILTDAKHPLLAPFRPDRSDHTTQAPSSPPLPL